MLSAYITWSKFHVHSVLVSDNLIQYLFPRFHSEVFKVGFCMQKAQKFLIKQIHEMKSGIPVVRPNLPGKDLC